MKLKIGFNTDSLAFGNHKFPVAADGTFEVADERIASLLMDAVGAARADQVVGLLPEVPVPQVMPPEVLTPAEAPVAAAFGEAEVLAEGHILDKPAEPVTIAPEDVGNAEDVLKP